VLGKGAKRWDGCRNLAFWFGGGGMAVNVKWWEKSVSLETDNFSS